MLSLQQINYIYKIQAVIELALLSFPKKGIRKEVCWTISNITAESPPQIQAVTDVNIIPPLINILSNANFKMQKEACWAISNAMSVALDGLDNILKVSKTDKYAGGPKSVNQYALYVEKVGGMITIHNLEIYKNVFNIMDKYFLDEKEVDAAISTHSLDATGIFADVTAS
ncbi:ARM repeat-containing protein [Suillus hirtellus]|nr:ARM repeat-containing protein [Suillus hirtellus]